MLDPDSLERLVPNAMDAADPAARETLSLHLDRYAFAARVAKPGRLLDLACGVGYGTQHLLAQNPALGPALGVDVSRRRDRPRDRPLRRSAAPLRRAPTRCNSTTRTASTPS